MSSKTAEMGGKSVSDNDLDPGVKPSLVNGSIDGLLTPELLYKMNKKIAQLTKVVYGLNTRGEELEGQLQAAKESEEKTKTQNADLQHRVNTFKAKIENEMGKLRELENQAKQAQIWKMECENLQRRLEAGEGIDGGSGALGHAREELEQLRMREAALQYELDQAKHAISNLKAHHDFIMRERDAQQVMENEKIILEWQTRSAEIENRYKVQIRRLSDDMEVMSSECNLLRDRALRASSAAGEEAILREQLRMLQIQHEAERREWEMKLRREYDDKEDERRKLTDEKLELLRRLRAATEERDEEKDDLEERLRSTKEYYEERISDLTSNQDLLQRLVDDKEEEFEVRLKTKVVEWKSEWDLAEEGLRNESKKLKSENIQLQSQVSTLKTSLKNAEPNYQARIQNLEEELSDKTSELDLKSKNFKVRVAMVENENRQYLQEKKDLEKFLEEERERFKSKLKNQESMCEKVKMELQSRLDQIQETEIILKETNKVLEENNDLLKRDKEDLHRKIKDKEREWEEKMEHELKVSEARVKQRIERLWLDKLKKTEETASYDIERLEDEKRRNETESKRENEELKKNGEENKKIIEELKLKLKEVRQREGERTRSLREVEGQLREARKREEILTQKQKELANQEEKYQLQIDDLTLKLAEKQQEVLDLVEELKEAQEKSQVNPNEESLQIKIEEMKKQVKLKENIAESIKVELEYKKNETQISKMRIERLEDELNKAKETIVSLQEQNSLRTKDSQRLKDVESKMRKLEEDLRKSEAVKKDLQENINEVEVEREEEMKIVQDALDEAAQEREELIMTFEKELKQLNSTNTAREQQMMEDFEWKLREMEKDHKKKLDEKERQLENTLQRVKNHAADDEEFRQKLEKMKSEMNSKWEDKLRSECSRLKSELDHLHAEEKRLAVESMKVQKEQEIHTLKKSWELGQEEMTKEISTLKDSLTDKDAYYHKDLEKQRTNMDREIWDLRMKLQKLNETSYDKQQLMEEKHKEEMERFRVDYEDRIRELESRLAARDAQAGIDLLGQLEKEHKNQMQHLEEQHRLSMERLREELESDKFQAVEEARVIITKHHEYIETNLKEQLGDCANTISQSREDIETLRQCLARKDETLRSLKEEVEKLHDSRGAYDTYTSPSAHSGLSSSQFSLSSSSDSQGSRSSHDRYYLPENTGITGSAEDLQRGNNSGILGKVFGGGWFTPTKSRESSRRGSATLSNKKPPYNS